MSEWDRPTHINIARLEKYKELGVWSRHYSTVRLTLGTFFISLCIGIFRFGEGTLGRESTAVVALLCSAIASLLFLAFTLFAKTKYKAQLQAYQDIDASKDRPVHTDLFDFDGVPTALGFVAFVSCLGGIYTEWTGVYLELTLALTFVTTALCLSGSAASFNASDSARAQLEAVVDRSETQSRLTSLPRTAALLLGLGGGVLLSGWFPKSPGPLVPDPATVFERDGGKDSTYQDFLTLAGNCARQSDTFKRVLLNLGQLKTRVPAEIVRNSNRLLNGNPLSSDPAEYGRAMARIDLGDLDAYAMRPTANFGTPRCAVLAHELSEVWKYSKLIEGKSRSEKNVIAANNQAHLYGIRIENQVARAMGRKLDRIRECRDAQRNLLIVVGKNTEVVYLNGLNIRHIEHQSGQTLCP